MEIFDINGIIFGLLCILSSKYLLSINVMVGKEKKIPAKIVCVRNKKNRKDWIAFICTKPSVAEEEI